MDLERVATDKDLQVLLVNAGSSSLKISVATRPISTTCQDLTNLKVDWTQPPDKYLTKVFTGLKIKPDAIVHRVVHGGELNSICKLNSSIEAKIEQASKFAPLHNPPALLVIRWCSKFFGEQTRHYAAFDTAFHSTIPERAYRYAIPDRFHKAGIRRYGFHGLSHAYVSSQIREICGQTQLRRLVSCHIGSGCSLAAILEGASIDTTMGLTPLEGLVMGTRSGSIDPSVLLEISRLDRCGVEQALEILNKQSGLLGTSKISADYLEVEAASLRAEASATLALDIFHRSVAKGILAMAVSMGGIDGLLFTGGIGENSIRFLVAVSEQLGFIGIKISDLSSNLSSSVREFTASGSSARVFAVKTKESEQMLKEFLVSSGFLRN